MPGSGKSFFQKKIIDQFKKKNFLKNQFKTLNKFEKLFFILIFFIKYPIFFIKTLYLINNKIKKKDKKNRFFYYFYNEIALRAYFEKNNKNKIILNDEGFLHRSIEYFDYNNNSKVLKSYLDILPSVNIIIYTYSNKKTNIKRTLNRLNEYRYNNENINEYFKKEKLLKKIVNQYKKNRKVIFIRIKNENQNTKKNLKKLFKVIKEIKI